MVCDVFGEDIYKEQGVWRPVKRGHVASEEGEKFCELTRLFGVVEGVSSLIGETLSFQVKPGHLLKLGFVFSS